MQLDAAAPGAATPAIVSWHAVGRRVSALLLSCVLLGAAPVRAFESDVHFGLTKFLALQAGFEPGQAEQIAIGSQRVDSGDMQFVALVLDYACLGRDAEIAGEVAAHHYPSAGSVPAPPEQRVVTAGSDAAAKSVREMETTQSIQANFKLQLLGQAIHVLQDSYAHQGVPDTPRFEGLFQCDASLAWAHPRARGGWNAHAADLVQRWPADTVAMAKATYDALLRFPPVGKTVRKPRAWEQIRPLLDGFVKASTKADKRAWFAARGVTDAAFLGGTSLPDGVLPFAEEWGNRRIPKLPALVSRQHETDPALLDFYNGFFRAWLTADGFDSIAADYAVAASAGKSSAAIPFDKGQLAARLRLWRIRDHGAVAEIAHAQGRLTRKQLAAVAALARNPEALARYADPADAVVPLVTNSTVASPLLPFIVRKAPAAANGNERAIAVAKLRHLPYDSIGVVGERVNGTWKVVALVAVVDH